MFTVITANNRNKGEGKIQLLELVFISGKARRRREDKSEKNKYAMCGWLVWASGPVGSYYY